MNHGLNNVGQHFSNKQNLLKKNYWEKINIDKNYYKFLKK